MQGALVVALCAAALATAAALPRREGDGGEPHLGCWWGNELRSGASTQRQGSAPNQGRGQGQRPAMASLQKDFFGLMGRRSLDAFFGRMGKRSSDSKLAAWRLKMMLGCLLKSTSQATSHDLPRHIHS